MLIDLELPKGRKAKSAAKLCMALGATLYLVMAWPHVGLEGAALAAMRVE